MGDKPTFGPKATNWFDRGGSNYAHYRPHYPPELAEYLIGLAPRREFALDVGCGSGQLTAMLAGAFEKTVGCDPSVSQLAGAARTPRAWYVCAAAECLPVRDRSVDLITVAQAAHWFRLPAFYAGVRRVARPGAVLALITYGTLHVSDPALDARFQRFYTDEIGPWWPPQRKLVDAGYRTLDFPFAEYEAPPLEISLHWPLAAFLGYLSTWSAVRHARQAGQGAVLERFVIGFSALWGKPERACKIVWPLHLRVGRVE